MLATTALVARSVSPATSKEEVEVHVKVEGALANEVGLIVLSLLDNFAAHFKVGREGGWSIRSSPGFFFWGPKKCVEKSNPPESKRKEKLNGTCFSCIALLNREL